MGIEDDIAASLPTPPYPAPARRAAAIDQALRRFDGLGDAEQTPPVGSRAARKSPLRLVPSPYAGAVLSLVLVALIGGPVLWDVMRDPALTTEGRQPPQARMADRAAPAAEVAATGLVSGPAADLSPPPGSGQAGAPSEAVAREPVAFAEAAPPAPAMARAAATVPMAQSDGRADEQVVVTGSRQSLQSALELKRQSTTYVDQIVAAPAQEADATAGDEMVITGTRRHASPLTAKASRAETAGSAVVASGYRAAPRGDWNACTVDDPNRDLAACRLADPAARRASGSATAHLADGLANAWRGELDEAIAAFDRAIATDPRSSSFYLNRGQAYRRSGDLDRALADFDRAVRYAPRAARTYYNRSLVLRRQGAHDRAAADERRAVALDPNYAAVVH